MHASKPLALLVAVGLLWCHGFYGAMHLLPADQAPMAESPAAQEATLAGSGSAHEDPVVQSVGEEYFAVLVVLLLGLFLRPLLRRADFWCWRTAPQTYFRLRNCLRVTHLAGDPTLPLLQVFRL